MDRTSQTESCNLMKELLDGYLDEELPERERLIVQSHLLECLPCAKQLSDLNRVVQTLKMIPKASFNLADNPKFDAIMGQPNASRHVNFALEPRVLIPLSVAAALIIVLGTIKVLMPESMVSQLAIKNKPTTEILAGAPTQEFIESIPNLSANSESVYKRKNTPVSDFTKTPEVSDVDKSDTNQGHDAQTDAGKSSSGQNAKQAFASKPQKQIKQSFAMQSEERYLPQIAMVGGEDNNDTIAADLPLAGSRLNDAIGLSTDEDGLYEIKM